VISCQLSVVSCQWERRTVSISLYGPLTLTAGH
jgi:hypothetical protein